MENIKILIDGIEKDVHGIFYIYNSKYYFIYTEKELDENGYVILYMMQVGKETANTPNGPVETGYMIGVEITDPNEQKNAQESISFIVEDKKNNTQNQKIQYLPMSMLVNFKVLGKKRFRLLKSVIVENFKLNFDEVVNYSNLIEPQPINPIVTPTNSITNMDNQVVTETSNHLAVEQSINQENIDTIAEESQNSEVAQLNAITQNEQNQVLETPDNIIVDYRTRYFEEEEKNKELQAQIDILTQKLNEIKKVIE